MLLDDAARLGHLAKTETTMYQSVKKVNIGQVGQDKRRKIQGSKLPFQCRT